MFTQDILSLCRDTSILDEIDFFWSAGRHDEGDEMSQKETKNIRKEEGMQARHNRM